MGGAKQHWMEQQELQPMYEWIEDNYGELNPDDNEKEWGEVVNEYNELLVEREEKEAYEHAAEEYSYYIHLTLEEADKRFSSDYVKLLQLLCNESGVETLLYKMFYAHAVTIFEVYMEEMVKSLLTHNSEFLDSYLQNSKAIADKRYSLKDIRFGSEAIKRGLTDEELKKSALRKVSAVSFHNIDHLTSTFEFGLARSLSIDLKPIKKIVALRHDVVHRNGVNKNGDMLNIGSLEVNEAINVIKSTARLIRNEVGRLPR